MFSDLFRCVNTPCLDIFEALGDSGKGFWILDLGNLRELEETEFLRLIHGLILSPLKVCGKRRRLAVCDSGL